MAILASQPALGETWYVSTAGDDLNDCLSPGTACRTVQAALDKSSDGDWIRVSPGTYAEPLTVHKKRSLTMSGNPTASIADPETGRPVVMWVNLSDEIRFEDLTFSGNPASVDALQIQDSRAVQLDRCIVEAAANGILAGESSVVLNESTVQDNFIGVRVDPGSTVVLNSAPFHPGVTEVRRNGAGAFIRGGTLVLHGSTVMRENDTGIHGEGGSLKACCAGSPRQIVENGTGVFGKYDDVVLNGPASISNNSVRGFHLTGGNHTLRGDVVVEGNAQDGISLAGGNLALEGAQVIGNGRYGLEVSDHSFVQIFENSVISDNEGGGAILERYATVWISDSASVTSNLVFDLLCRSGSLAFGNLSVAQQCVWNI